MKKTVKIIVSGDGGVGKTSFLNRLVYDFFNDRNELTKGVDFYSKILQVRGIEFNFILWDFAGQSQFKDIVDDFVEGSIAAFVLFDLSRINTIESVFNWVNKLGEWGNIPVIILGTKCDLVDPETCSFLDDYILKLLHSNRNIVEYMKISSKTGFNINQAFNLLLMKLSE